MTPRKVPLHSHRNFGLKPIMQVVRDDGSLITIWLLAAATSGTIVGLIIGLAIGLGLGHA